MLGLLGVFLRALQCVKQSFCRKKKGGRGGGEGRGGGVSERREMVGGKIGSSMYLDRWATKFIASGVIILWYSGRIGAAILILPTVWTCIIPRCFDFLTQTAISCIKVEVALMCALSSSIKCRNCLLHPSIPWVLYKIVL